MKSGFSRAKRGFVVSLFAASALAVSAAAGSGRLWHQLGVGPGLDNTNLVVRAGFMATVTSISYGVKVPSVTASVPVAGKDQSIDLVPGSQVIGPATVTVKAGTYLPPYYSGPWWYAPAIAVVCVEPVDIGAQVMVEASRDLKAWVPVGDALLPADPGTNVFYRVKLNPVSQSR